MRLITGGLGYIGSYLLQNNIKKIITNDNFYTQRYCFFDLSEIPFLLALLE